MNVDTKIAGCIRRENIQHGSTVPTVHRADLWQGVDRCMNFHLPYASGDMESCFTVQGREEAVWFSSPCPRFLDCVYIITQTGSEVLGNNIPDFFSTIKINKSSILRCF